MRTLLEGAAADIGWQAAVWGVLGLVLGVLGVLAFQLVTALVLGDPRGKWAGTWRASVVVALALAALTGSVIGAGEGAIGGAEAALRKSAFGRETLPRITSMGVNLYAVVYFTDPESLKTSSVGDLLRLRKIREVQSFARGTGVLQTDRLERRMEVLEPERLLKMARGAHDDMRRLTPMIEKELPGLGKAGELVMEFALKPQAAAEELGGLAMAPLKDVRSAAARHGDPTTVTQAELSEHLRERVVVPALLAPLMAMIRPWQIAAIVLLALMVSFLLPLRWVVWSTMEPDELANSSDSN